MEDHQEFEKPIFELQQRKFRSTRKKKNRFGESTNRYEDIFCYYGLKESPKTKTKKMKKRLIRCVECNKGFRYEKCLRNHSETMHPLKEKKKKESEAMRRDLLCFFSSCVQRRKRSRRVSRYKKSPTLSVSASSSSFGNDGELLEVAESLIMLSKSGDALFSNLEMKQRDCEDGFLRNEPKIAGEFTYEYLSSELKLVGSSNESDGTSKELLGFLGDKKVKKEDDSGQLKRVVAGGEDAVERVSLEDRLGLKLGAVFEVSNSGSKGLLMNNEHQCRLCERVFSSYQALGGHQTYHRMRNSCEKPKHEMQRRVSRS